MKKNDFWTLSLVVLWIIAFETGWPIWMRIAVIANAVLVLWYVAMRIYKAVKRRG